MPQKCARTDRDFRLPLKPWLAIRNRLAPAPGEMHRDQENCNVMKRDLVWIGCGSLLGFFGPAIFRVLFSREFQELATIALLPKR